jgi:spore maturation protein A
MNIFFSLILFASVAAMVIINPAGVLPAMTEGAGAGLSFSVKLFAIYAIWLSVLKVLEKSGADKGIAKLLSPVSKALFKDEDKQTFTFINLNMSANLLGMGGAATPMGIKAIEVMKHRKNKIMLVVLNSAGIQLIPTTIISLRAGLDSTLDIIIPCLIVNAFTIANSIILVKVFVK